ncbi:unnamed protein product [Parnassius mnemosyne]|uniref:Peptidase A2 domain-containing protein n=1 Tax=Parnassius mnemosyne TaxID=213953 RepID=A0AAV1L763_9NEOP
MLDQEREEETSPVLEPLSRNETVAHVMAPNPNNALRQQGALAPYNAGAHTPGSDAASSSGGHTSGSEVLVKVNICGPCGSVTTYALLDDGASVSMIDKNLVKELGLSPTQSNPVKFIDAFGIEVYQSDAPKICTKISGFFENIFYDVTFRQVDKLKLPKQNMSVVDNLNCKYLLYVKDFVCKQCVVPRLLIWQDNYFLLAPLEVLHGNKQKPYATRCRLRWSIHGCYVLTHSSVKGHILHLHIPSSRNRTYIVAELSGIAAFNPKNMLCGSVG